jgi:OpgC protein
MPARLVALAGRKSLPVFVLSLLLSTISNVILKETGFAFWIQCVVALVGMALMIGFGVLLNWQSHGSRKNTAPSTQAIVHDVNLKRLPWTQSRHGNPESSRTADS